MMIGKVAQSVITSQGPPGDLADVCQQFEALFISELLKPLDSTLSGGKSDQGVLAPIARQTVASQLAGSLGVGELLYQQLVEQASV